MVWLALMENYSFVALALGQRHLLISLLGFLLMLGLSLCWRRQSPLTLLAMWLIYLLSPLAGLISLPQALAAQLPAVTLPLLRGLPPVISAPCDTPFEARLSSQVLPLLPLLSWHLLLAGLWAVVVAWRARRLWQSRRRFRALVQRAQPLRDASILQLADSWRNRYRIRRSVHWCTSAETDYAFTLGWLRPMVLLPDWMLTRLRPEELDIVIGHELAHVKRWDDFFLLLQQAFKTIFFFNPMLWFSNRKIDGLREQCCDLLALRTAGLKPAHYAQHLLRVADHYTEDSTDLRVVAGMVSADLRQRVTGLIRARTTHFAWLPVLVASALLLILKLAFELNVQTPASASESAGILRSIGAVSPLPHTGNRRAFIWSSSGCMSLPEPEAYHPGVDFTVPPRTTAAVRAISDGHVAAITSPAVMLSYTRTVQVQHRNDVASIYHYIDELHVKPGEVVHAGQVIGYIHGGNSGKHLHIAVQQDHRILDPSFLTSL